MEDIKDGYTRVSAIISQWDKMSNIDPMVLERKTALGTNVHKAISDHYNGIPSVLTDEEGGKYFSSFLIWNEANKPVPVRIEERLYDDDLMITGCLDAILKFPDSDEIILIDWKTSYNADKLNWPLQASFYLSLLAKNGIHGLTKARFIKLDKLGDMPKEFEFIQSEYLLQTCRAAYITYMYQLPWLEKRKTSIEEYME